MKNNTLFANRNRHLIKVCGMTDMDNIKEVAQLDIDLMGFIFYPKSPRFVRQITSMAGIIPDYSEERLHRQAVEKRADQAEHTIQRVGVFVDDMPQTIVTRIYNYQLDFVQLHGSELPVMIENLRRTLVPDIVPQIGVVKTISVSSAADFVQTADYEGLVDAFLFDTKCEEKGGSGRQFDWHLLDEYKGATPFLLSGGIGPDDAETLRAIDHPMFAGVDLNSKFETAPGMKDVESLRKFIETFRS